MGLFDKKYCDFCGEKIKLLGNRKLEDGNMCKACASKLSPWFSERRQSTVEEIKGQLEYREANKAEVASFNTTLTYGINTKVLIDENQGKFMVTAARNLQDANPDVMKLSDITGCRVDIDESRYEMTEDGPDHETIHYSPAQYGYDYDFYIVLNINNPYFNEIRFKLNDDEIKVEPTFTASRPLAIRRQPDKDGKKPPIPPIRVSNVQPANPKKDASYSRFNVMAEDIKRSLLNTREEAKANAAPKQAVTCPCCGASTIPDANGCCEYCGSAVNG